MSESLRTAGFRERLLEAENAQLRRCLTGDHDWKDITSHGDRDRVKLCLCGERTTEPFESDKLCPRCGSPDPEVCRCLR